MESDETLTGFVRAELVLQPSKKFKPAPNYILSSDAYTIRIQLHILEGEHESELVVYEFYREVNKRAQRLFNISPTHPYLTDKRVNKLLKTLGQVMIRPTKYKGKIVVRDVQRILS